ncbi:histone H1-delta [Biomphalaria glabrata]|nr:histone H1-delta-like [Biomphalaria glabrata]
MIPPLLLHPLQSRLLRRKPLPSLRPQQHILNTKAMIQAAIVALKERGGSSRQAILKYIAANYKVGDNPTAINARLKAALKAGVKAGTLKQSKGTGAAGSFRLGEKKAEKKPKAKKVAVKKPKSPKKAAAC